MKADFVSDSFMDKSTKSVHFSKPEWMELTVANDFQNNLNQATVISSVSHLADTLCGTEFLSTQRQETEIIQFIKKNSIKKLKGSLISLEPCLA